MRVLSLVLVGGCGFQVAGVGPVDLDAGLDATEVLDGAPTDGPAAFDPMTCPASYTLVVAGTTSRYRAVLLEGSFLKQHQLCNEDLPGATHLVSLETSAELLALKASLLALTTTAPSNRYYVGAVQRRDQASTTAGWLVFSGADLPANPWSDGQPNDDDPGENNQENLALINPAALLNDATGDIAYGAVCECDGLAIGPAIVALIP